MDFFRKRRIRDRALTVGISAAIVLAGLGFIWRGTGRSLVRLHADIQNRQHDIEQLRDEILVSRKLFLEGEAAETIRSQFEERATPSQYFGDVLSELRRRERDEWLLLRSISLEPPERAGDVTRIRFSIEIDAPFGTMTSFLTYLEEAFPAYQVNHLVLARSDGERSVKGNLSGSLFMPQ